MCVSYGERSDRWKAKVESKPINMLITGFAWPCLSCLTDTQNFMMTSSHGSIFRVTGPLCGEFTGHRWIPLTKASDVELGCFLWSMSEYTVELTIVRLVIWDAIVLIMTSLCCWAAIAAKPLLSGVSNHRQLQCLFNTLLRITTKKHQRCSLLSLFVRKIPRWLAIDSLHKGPVIRKAWRHNEPTSAVYMQ